jgi:hypothetical protein
VVDPVTSWAWRRSPDAWLRSASPFAAMVLPVSKDRDVNKVRQFQMRSGPLDTSRIWKELADPYPRDL